MTDTELAAILSRAFDEGFGVSREGFNNECAFDHLAPDGLTLEELRDITVKQIIEEMGA